MFGVVRGPEVCGSRFADALGMQRIPAGKWPLLLLALSTFRCSAPPELAEANGSVTVHHRKLPQPLAQYLADILDDLNQSGPQLHALVLTSTNASQAPGVQLHRYAHKFEGVAVADEVRTLWVVNDTVVGEFGELTRLSLNTAPTLGVSEASSSAQATLSKLMRDDAKKLGRPIDAILPQTQPCELQIQSYPSQRSPQPAPRLQYKCDLYTSGLHSSSIILDADSGDLIARQPLVHPWQSAPVTGVSRYDQMALFGAPAFGIGPMLAELENGTYRLQSPIATVFDAQGGPPSTFVSASTVTHSSPLFDLPTLYDAIEINWGIQHAAAAITEHLEVAPFNGINTENRLKIYANFSDPPERSHNGFHPDVGNYIAFQAASAANNSTHPEIVGHEAGHSLLTAQAPNRTLYLGEGAVIEEGFADIISQLVEIYMTGSTDYRVAGTNQSGDDPFALGQPDVYLAFPWLPTSPATADQAHHNATVLHRWWRLSVESKATSNSVGTPFSTVGLGATTPTAILFEGYRSLSPGNGFVQLRDATKTAATQICGEFSQAANTVHHAWYAVGLEATPSPPTGLASPTLFSPAPDPWRTRIFWQTHQQGPPESSWVFQISEHADFSSVIELATTTIEQESGVDVGVVEIGLKPATDYYWRVRREDTNPKHNCWRPVQEFTTHDAVPVPITPVAGPAHHPWRLPFRMELSPGTDRVEIKVSAAADMSTLIFPPKTFIVDESNPNPDKAQAYLTVLKDQRRLFWTAIAFDDETMSQSASSAPQVFETNDPKPVAQTPSGGALVPPWNIDFVWEELHAAAEYTFFYEEQNGTNAGLARVLGSELSVTRSFASSLGPKMNWRVKALGPPLGSESQPEDETTAEESQWSDFAKFKLDHSKTVVNITSPRWDNVVRPCMVLDQTRVVTWDPVVDAEEIRIELTPLRVSAEGPPVVLEEGVSSLPGRDPTHTITVPGIMISAQVPVDIPPPGFVGYEISARAYGPEGVPGGFPKLNHLGSFVVRPPRPTAMSPDQISGWTNPDWLRVAWSTAYAPQGRFLLEVYQGTSCTGAPHGTVAFEPPFSGNAQGVTAYEWGIPVGTYSWRVRPAWDDLCSSSALQWSGCPEQGVSLPPPPNLPHVECGDVVHWGGNEGLTYIVDLPGSNVSGEARLTHDHYCVPDQTLLKKSTGEILINTGCEGSGTWSTSGGPIDLLPDQSVHGNCVHSEEVSAWERFENASYLTLEVHPNCLGFSNTAWEVRVECQLD